MIPIASRVRVWIATGYTDMRRGMNSLALLVQEDFKRDPHGGDLYVFRARAYAAGEGTLIRSFGGWLIAFKQRERCSGDTSSKAGVRECVLRGRPAGRASTSAGQACGSMSLSLALARV